MVAGRRPTAEAQQELASLFLRTLAFERATKQVSADALTFIERARVYDVTVPSSALVPLAEGLSIDFDRHLVALQNLGLLEVGRYRGGLAHRVSPLVAPEFDAEEPERWHAVAAAFWWAEHENGGLSFDQIEMGWRHALRAKRELLAKRFAHRLHLAFFGRGLYRQDRDFAQQQLDALPDSPSGLVWLGDALALTGEPRKGWAYLSKGVAQLEAAGISEDDLWVLDRVGSLLLQLGRLDEAAGQLERSLEIQAKVHGTDEHPSVAASLHELARVLQAQGDLSGAKKPTRTVAAD